MKSFHISASAIALAAGSAAAQFSITPGGANAGNGIFSREAVAAGATGVGPVAAIFRPTNAASLDSLFQHGWWLRANGDTREYTFATNAASPAISGIMVGNNANTLDSGGYDFTVTNAAYSFTSQQRYIIVAAPGGPVTTCTCMITNTGASTLNISLFSYCDIDAVATAGGDSYAINAAGNTFQVQEGTTLAEFRATNPLAYQAQVFAGLRTLLSDTAVTNLTNTVTGSPGDFTGAFQWNLQIAPNASATVSSAIAYVSSFTQPCYANCDGSTATPLLTANDFQCFINEYAANHSYANCDGSTATPALTANDFQCFINKYAAGCT